MASDETVWKVAKAIWRSQKNNILRLGQNEPVEWDKRKDCYYLDAQCAIAALSRPAGGAPVWMVRDRATGKIWIDEVCVWSDEMSARECAEDMNENIDDANFEAVAMLAAAPTPPSGEDEMATIDAELAAEICDEWLTLHENHVTAEKIERFKYAPQVEELRNRLRAIAASREVGK